MKTLALLLLAFVVFACAPQAFDGRVGDYCPPLAMCEPIPATAIESRLAGVHL